jgi:hypothetical protein
LNPGIHFEHLGELRFFNNKWKLVTFVELENISNKLLSLKNYRKYTTDLCNNENAQYHYYICQLFLKSSKYTFEKIEKELEVLHELIGHSHLSESRQKRGWFNIVGKATKVLFGVLDEEDAKYYNDKISQMNKDETSVLQLLKEQTKIVQSTIINFNNTIGTLDFNENLLKNNIKKISDELSKVKENFHFLYIKTGIEEHVTILNMMLNQLQLEIMTITNAILVARKGVLHPSILTPLRLINELKDVSESLPHGLEFPVPLDPLNANLILNVIELQVYFENKRLIYIINIPLIETNLFYIYKISPFPKLMSNNQFILIQPSSKYIAIDESKQQFITLSEIEFNTCLKIIENKFICKQQKPVSLAHLADNCEVKLLQFTNIIPDICDKRIIQSDRAIFIQLQTSNTWLFAVPHPETLTISCNNKKNHVDVILKNCGSVTIGKQCKAYSASSMLIPHGNTVQSNISSDFIPPFDISDNCCERIKEEKINISEIFLNEHYRKLTKHIPELNVASHKLEDIEKLGDEILKRKLVNNYTFPASVIAYILALLAIIFIIYKLYTKCTNKTACCGIIPNLCIRVNQSVEPSSRNSDRYVAHYNRNISQNSENVGNYENSEEENVNLQAPSRRPIGYVPSRRPLKEK